MSIVILQLPKVKRESSERPRQCRYCKGEILQRWGQAEKRVKDTKVRRVRFHRYRCTSCRRTFRHYPAGVSCARQTERLKALAAVCWSFGLSHRKVSLVLSAFGVSLSRMSSWRDVQESAEAIRKRAKWRPARVVGVDGAWQNGVGVMVAVDLGDGQPLAIGRIDERDAAGVQRWLRQLQQEHGITAIVTDDLAMYRGMAERLGLEHQVCQFHVRRWVGRAYRQLQQKLPEEWLGILEEIKRIMEELPPEGGRQLFELWKQVPGNQKQGQVRTAVDELRSLLIRLSESYERYTAFFHDPGIPWTNNRTEQAIGKMKVRAKSVRGYKTTSGRLNGLLVSSSTLT